MTLACTERLQHADLTRALGDANQHDVHHADATHAEREDADNSHHYFESDGKVLQHLPCLDGVPSGSGLVVARIEMMAQSEDMTRGVESFGVKFGGDRLNNNHVGITLV